MTTDVSSSVLRRWLTALGLIATAEELVRRGDDTASSTALIAADSAVETLLGVMGGWTDESLPLEPKYHQVMERARRALEVAGLRLPPALQQDLRSVHALRNSVVHHGALAPASEALLACRAARQLLELMPAVSAYFVAMPTGGGVVTAIASLLDAPDLTAQLRVCAAISWTKWAGALGLRYGDRGSGGGRGAASDRRPVAASE